MLIHFIDLVKDKKSFIVELELNNMDWQRLLENAISNGLLPNKPN